MRVLLLLVASVLLAGCTTEVTGTPSAPSGVLLPPRPREVRLDGVDPCSLLTPEQRAGLGLESEPKSSTAYVDLFHGEVRTCTMRGSYPASSLLGLSVVTTAGIERWQQGDLQAEVHPTEARGFPALTAVPVQHRDYCSVEVDVAAGQLLDIQFGSSGSSGSSLPIPQEELCTRARLSADAAMTTLLVR